MKKKWRTFIIYTDKDIVIDSLEAWCKFATKLEDWQVIRDYWLRAATRIDGQQVAIFEYNPYTKGKLSIPGFFKKLQIDFRPPKGTMATKTRNELILYYYLLARKEGRTKVCSQCTQASEEKNRKCPFCANDKFGDIELAIKNITKIVKPPEPKFTKGKTIKADPNEVNSGHKRFKFSDQFEVLKPWEKKP